MYRDILTPLAFEVALTRERPLWRRGTYQKILVPLDKSSEAEKVLPYVQEILAPEGQGILLHVVPLSQPAPAGERPPPGDRQETAERARAMAMGYLRCVVSDLIQVPGRWRCEVVASPSVAQGIADFAIQDGVDLIAMYTHDRKGLARLVRGSIAEQVQRTATVSVRVLRPGEPVIK